MTDKITQLKKNVLEAIRSKNVSMRPKWHFLLRAMLLVTGIIITFLSAVFLISLAVFALRSNGVWFAPMFGPRGVGLFLFAVPWIVVIASFVFIGVMELLVTHFAFAYRRPLLYSLLLIVAVVLLGSAAVARTSFHGKLSERARTDRLPLAGPLYERFGNQRPKSVFKGVIVSATKNEMILKDSTDDEHVIIWTTKTHVAPEWLPEVGEQVVVFGEGAPDGSTINAFGIHPIPEGAPPFPRPRGSFSPPNARHAPLP